MEIVTAWEHLRPQWPYPVLTIGNFDGLHRGHQQLIAHVIERAQRRHGTSMVLTFDPHPTRVLAPERAQPQIQTWDQKVAMLQALGIDVLIVIRFTREFSRWSARDFAVQILAERLGVKELYVGPNFSFGRGREGHVDLLERVGREKGFTVGTIPEVYFRRLRISSTGIRQYLVRGQVSLARRLLGRPYALRGVVVHGEKLGARLGFPTANLKPESEIIPKLGVYITYMRVAARRYRSVTNIGVRPTLHAPTENPAATIETFLFAFEGDLYQQTVDLEFCTRLRDEQRFPNKEALVAQIQKDVRLSQAYFNCIESGVESPESGVRSPESGVKNTTLDI